MSCNLDRANRTLWLLPVVVAVAAVIITDVVTA